MIRGPACDAATRFPKNANVAAALALAGAGFDKAQVELVADPFAIGNSHSYRAVSPICSYRMEITAGASKTARTPQTTVSSILAELRKIAETRSRPDQR